MKRIYAAPQAVTHTCAEILGQLGPALATYTLSLTNAATGKLAGGAGTGRSAYDPN